MLSDVTYERLAGTSVLRDFVELPSQLFEHWLSQPVVLKKWARHYQTGEPIPDELLKRLIAAKCFNKGFETGTQHGVINDNANANFITLLVTYPILKGVLPPILLTLP